MFRITEEEQSSAGGSKKKLFGSMAIGQLNTMERDKDWQPPLDPDYRNRTTDKMAETIRNETIYQIAVGGHIRATKPAAANPQPQRRGYDKGDEATH